MAALDLTAFSGALKTVYSKDMVENLTYKDNPFHALVRKDKNFYGKNFQEALIYGNPQAGGVTIAVAQASVYGSNVAGFVLTRAVHYNIAQLSNEVIMASSKDVGALLKALTTEIDGAMRACIRHLAVMEYGDGTGVIGVAGTQTNGSALSATSVTSFILNSLPSVTNFEVNMSVVIFSNTQSSGVYTGGTARGVRRITNIDRSTGTLTLSSAATLTTGDIIVMGTGTTIGAGPTYIGTDNDLNAVLTGLSGWIPLTAPSSTPTFFGVDRSVDATRLAGVRTSATTVAIDEAIVNGLRDVGREGGSPDYAFMDFENYASLVKLLQPVVRFEDKPKANISFTGIMVNGPRGQVKCVPDRNCPADRVFLLTMSTWTLRSLQDAPMIIETDGLRLLRNATADTVEVRIGYYAQLGCSAPGMNGVVQLS